MKLIDILRKRASDDKFEKDICSWLSSKADKIIKDASDHLKYVQHVLDEFDIHDAGHSEGVLKVMEDLLGDDAERLSSYDLFSLIAVAYLHDCGMAVSDAEINVMKLVENDEFDGKKVCTEEEAKRIIESKRTEIFKTERDAEEIKNWLFYPGSEQKLFDYYAMLLREYQTFRNGKKDDINKSIDHDKTNKELRLEYIRNTHADRAETYINTWKEKEIADLLGNQPMGQLLFENIAQACKAHCKNADYIKEELNKDAQYVGCESSNLQFVAMMLRIGDIVHFDYKRAPVVLRALHHFESDDSHEHWRIKADSGVNFSIKDRVIACRANCKAPKDFYNLMTYVNWIDHELELYNVLKKNEGWEEHYPDMPKKVDRKNMKHVKDFTPVPNLKFTLEQNKILKLLMGAELYSDEYACLRELYQNSLDACRCQIAKNNSEGKIEFGLKTEEGEKYVYCLDNGKGMSKHIIQNYLLKIGSSYYKSAEFYQSQAESGNTFTPTSQFGIGILSCFMIGDRVEITTREDGKEYISCVMENIHECFYYKATPQKDKDVIPSSGTLVKIFLNSEYRKRMRNEYLEHIGYWLWKKEEKYENHLYFILDGFVKMVPKDIILTVQLNEGKPIKIDSKPQPMGTGIYAFPQNDKNKSNIEIRDTVFKDLDVEHEGIRYRSYLLLSTEFWVLYPPNYWEAMFGRDVLGRAALCVDGLKVDNNFVNGRLLRIISSSNIGVLNFIGAERPQLSISREEIVKYNPNKYEGKIKELLGKMVKQGFDITAEYIAEKNVKPGSELYKGIWNTFFKRFETIPVDIVAQHLSGESISNLVMPLPNTFTTSQMTYGDFWGEKVCFEDYCMIQLKELMDYPNLLHQLIEYRMGHSASVTFDGNKAIITGYLPNEDFPKYPIPSNSGLFQDYDIVASLYPFVSVSFCRWLDEDIYNSLYHSSEKIIMTTMGDDYKYMDSALPLLTEYLSKESDKNNGYPELYSCVAGFFNKNRHILKKMIDNYEIDKLIHRIGTNMIITFYIPISKERLDESRLYAEWEYLYPKEQEKRLERSRFLDGILFLDYDSNVNDRGFSVIIFLNGDKSTPFDFYAISGCWTRQELINKIPDDVWNRLPRMKYRFTDGTEIVRKKAQP